MIRSPAWNPGRSRAATVLVSVSSSVATVATALPTRVELLPFDLKRLDSLAIENVLDPLLKAGQKFRSGGDFSHVVMELDQVNEDGPRAC